MRSPLYTLLNVSWVVADLARSGLSRSWEMVNGNNDQAVRNVRSDITRRQTSLRRVNEQLDRRVRLSA